jgi:ComF family protein
MGRDSLVRCTRHFCRSALTIIFADCCVLCGSPADSGRFCDPCRRSLPRIARACYRCGGPVALELPPGVDCAGCQLRPPPFCAARAPLQYAFPVDCALKALKFNGSRQYAPAFAEFMMAELTAHFRQVDALVPVPLHRWRHARRGFNQAFELCRPLARKSGLPLLTAIRRVRNTLPQTGLSAAARRRNLRHAFALSGSLDCRHPLIVDDVMTTGETCTQLARVLLEGGAEDVSVLTAARAAPWVQPSVQPGIQPRVQLPTAGRNV